jgi:bacterioferritin
VPGGSTAVAVARGSCRFHSTSVATRVIDAFPSINQASAVTTSDTDENRAIHRKTPATSGRNDARTHMSGEDAMAVVTEASDRVEVASRMSKAVNPVPAILNGLLGATWRAYAQHQTHVALIEGWGLKGLAGQMRVRTADEPVTINTLLNRLGDLDGAPAFTIDAPTIGATVREVLDNDMALQRYTRPMLNAAAEAAAAAHDATSRNLIEQILADEEQHLAWLETEIELCAKLGDALYVASRL